VTIVAIMMILFVVIIVEVMSYNDYIYCDDTGSHGSRKCDDCNNHDDSISNVIILAVMIILFNVVIVAVNVDSIHCDDSGSFDYSINCDDSIYWQLR
jgi:hypothetical protein